MDESDLKIWIETWYSSTEEEEFEALVRIFESTSIKFEDFKQRLQLLGLWRSDMEDYLKPPKKDIDI